MGTWIRMTANMAAGAYDINEAMTKIPEPNWPEETLKQLLKVAFRDRIITDVGHPVVQQLLGQV
jgi:hypothetical protein